MAINLKKFIAVLSSLAITASVMPMALAAETPDDNGVYYDEDFSGIPAGTLVNLGSPKNDTYSDMFGVTFSCRDRNDDQSAQGINLSNGSLRLYANKYVAADKIQPTITLDWTNGATFENDRVMSFDITGAVGTEVVVTDSAKSELTIPLPSAKTLNCNIYSKTDDAATYVLLYDASTDELVKIITSETVLVDFATITATKNKSFSYTLDNLKVSDISVDIPVVEFDEDVTRVEVGTSVKVASLKATDYDIELSNDTDFSYELDGEDVYLKASENASKGAKTTVTITGKGTVEVSKTSGEISALTQDEIVQEAYDELVLSGMGVTLVDGTEYTVTSSFDLPVPSNREVEVSWSASLSGYAKVNDTVVKVTKDEAMEGETVTLKATISYGDVSMEKVFTLDLSFNPKDVYYDESFDEFPTGTVVNLSNTENTSYVTSNGMSFTCGSRDKSGDEIGVIINATGDDKFMTIANSNYTGQGRRPVVSLTRKANATNNIVVKADIRFAAADDDLLLYDASSNMLKLNVPADDYAGKWLNYTIIGGSGKVKILVKDADGKVLTYYTGDAALRGVASISLTDTNASTVAINNLYIADDIEKITDEDIVAAAKSNLEIDDLTYKSGVYTATSDFDLPVNPEDTEVTWTAMQKAKDATEWESSSFIKISGTTAVINPTNDIDNYDVKLVATITSGEATDTAEFVIDLPNPMDEINGILSNNFNIVNTTDLDTSSKTITFDLNGEDMLKRDLVLPISYKKYENTKITWTSSSNEHLSIADDGTATVMTSDFNSHDVTLTAVVTYKKGDITYSSDPQEFKITMGFESSDKTSGDDTMGKYRVRYDAAYENNFDIPTSTSSNIKLPTEGEFGSEFKWTSSAPTVISNTGKFTRPSSAKTVTLTADIISGSASGTAKFTVTVLGTNNSSGGGGGGGGGSSSRTASSTGTINNGTSSSTISTPSSSTGVPVSDTSAADTVSRLQEEALASKDLFIDIPQAAWARDAINGLAKAGVINGKSDTLFAPNDTVTRAEFAKMLMGAFGLASDAYTTSSFNDVPAGEWYFQFVESAYNLGIIQGTGNGTFEPNALITRQDMAVMVARAAQIAGKDLAVVRDMLGFADNGSIASYATEAVEQLVKAGAMSGKSDTEFAPLENATRAQAAQILFNLVG